ncbi:MAG: lytic transglycosylase domain-containing protein [Acidobacteriaceae bacterium]
MQIRALQKTAACAASAVLALLCTGCPQQQPASPRVPSRAVAPAIANTSAPADVAAAQAAATKAASVQRLIDQVQAAYRSGVEDYRTGHLDAARQDFDRSVDMMLTSGIDIQSDPQLNDEFEHVVDAVNSLEMNALKQGNGFAPKVEPAPVDAANDVTFPSNAKLNAELNAELKTTQSDMPLVINDYVAGYISYFTNSKSGHATLVHSLERAGKYRAMIQKVLAEENVPQDLIYLAVAESGFQPQALNPHSGAGGMWQFMPFNGYGLVRNGWVDERFDPEKSSRAYARYIKSLHDQFGDWYLAMAAYDWGPGYVQRAVERTGYADYWELYRRNVLPQETKNYVPGIIAAIIMAKNPQKYGLADVTPDPPVVSDTVTVDYSIDLRLVSDLTGASAQEIAALNPSLLRTTTPRDMDFDLHLPAGTKDLFAKRVAAIPESKRATWRFHIVTTGESLGEVAQNFHVKTQDLAQANGIDTTDELSTGEPLAIPVAPAASTAGTRTARYKVKRGDTLVAVADRFNVSVEQLTAWNHLRSSRIAPGRMLNVAEPLRLAPATRSHRRSSSRSASAKTTPAGASQTARKVATSSKSGSAKTQPSKRKSGQ